MHPLPGGSRRLFEILDKITTGRGEAQDLNQLKLLSESIKDTALCGLGQTMPNPILSTMDTFANEYEAHVTQKKCPAHVCTAMLTYTIDAAKCTGCTLCTKVCPVDCISGTKKQPHVIDASKCIKCGACYDKCKFDSVIKL